MSSISSSISRDVFVHSRLNIPGKLIEKGCKKHWKILDFKNYGGVRTLCNAKTGKLYHNLHFLG